PGYPDCSDAERLPAEGDGAGRLRPGCPEDQCRACQEQELSATARQRLGQPALLACATAMRRGGQCNHPENWEICGLWHARLWLAWRESGYSMRQLRALLVRQVIDVFSDAALVGVEQYPA